MTELVQDSSEARRVRRMQRLRQVLVELDRESAGLVWGELWRRVTQAFPLVDDDTERNKSGTQRGETDVRFYMTNLDKAGWVLTGVGPNRITAAGRAALRSNADDASLYQTANEAYRDWEALRQPPATSAPGLLDEALVRTEYGEPVILAAARMLLEHGLRAGGSAFDPGRRVWDASTVSRLRTAFVEHPDAGSQAFMDKLHSQLRTAGDDAILLTAEMLSVLLLPLADWKPDTKRQRVKTVLAMMADPVHMAPLVSAAMDHQVFGGGVAFKTLLWRALATVIEVASAWWRLDDAGRDAAWQDPWAWRALMSATEGDAIASARAELCYLLHPRTFLPIVSTDDRLRIRDAFADEIPELTGDVDLDLHRITVALQVRSEGPVNFYAEPFLERWRSVTPVGRRAWLVRPGQVGAPLVARWCDEGFVSVLAKHLGQVPPGSDLPALRTAVDAGYQHVDYAQRLALAGEYHAFLSRMKADDVVVTLAGDTVHVGVITGEADYPPDDEGIIRREVAWQSDVDKASVDASVTSLLSKQGIVVDLTAGLDALGALLPSDVIDVGDGSDRIGTVPPLPQPPEVPTLPAVSPALATTLHMPPEALQEIVDLLQSRQQIVLYGPPGTGKTFLARKLAEHMVGADDPSRARLVQFHPSYAYEDFFEGFRPAETAAGHPTFSLQPGPLRQLASEAAKEENRGTPFVLIIDEMNRANLAKVFGELYFLLEYRAESIQLQYQPTEAFRLPRNLFVIGTMNTADRSIAMVDAAIRRRFAFVELHPDAEPVRGVLSDFLKATGGDPERAELLKALNAVIEDQDRDLRIGPSYLMKPDAATPEGLERVWRYDLLPLLEEHYYGRMSRDAVHQRFGLPSLRASLAGSPLDEDLE